MRSASPHSMHTRVALRHPPLWTCRDTCLPALEPIFIGNYRVAVVSKSAREPARVAVRGGRGAERTSPSPTVRAFWSSRAQPPLN